MRNSPSVSSEHRGLGSPSPSPYPSLAPTEVKIRILNCRNLICRKEDLIRVKITIDGKKHRVTTKTLTVQDAEEEGFSFHWSAPVDPSLADPVLTLVLKEVKNISGFKGFKRARLGMCKVRVADLPSEEKCDLEGEWMVLRGSAGQSVGEIRVSCFVIGWRQSPQTPAGAARLALGYSGNGSPSEAGSPQLSLKRSVPAKLTLDRSGSQGPSSPIGLTFGGRSEPSLIGSPISNQSGHTLHSTKSMTFSDLRPKKLMNSASSFTKKALQRMRSLPTLDVDTRVPDSDSDDEEGAVSVGGQQVSMEDLRGMSADDREAWMGQQVAESLEKAHKEAEERERIAREVQQETESFMKEASNMDLNKIVAPPTPISPRSPKTVVRSRSQNGLRSPGPPMASPGMRANHRQSNGSLESLCLDSDDPPTGTPKNPKRAFDFTGTTSSYPQPANHNQPLKQKSAHQERPLANENAPLSPKSNQNPLSRLLAEAFATAGNMMDDPLISKLNEEDKLIKETCRGLSPEERAEIATQIHTLRMLHLQKDLARCLLKMQGIYEKVKADEEFWVQLSNDLQDQISSLDNPIPFRALVYDLRFEPKSPKRQNSTDKFAKVQLEATRLSSPAYTSQSMAAATIEMNVEEKTSFEAKMTRMRDIDDAVHTEMQLVSLSHAVCRTHASAKHVQNVCTDVIESLHRAGYGTLVVRAKECARRRAMGIVDGALSANGDVRIPKTDIAVGSLLDEDRW